MNSSKAYVFNAGVLFGIARDAYQRMGAEIGDIEGGQNDALVAILFSAATLESFISEVQLEAETPMIPARCPAYISNLAQILDEAEAGRASVRLKFLLAKAILPGEGFDKGKHPYQDFNLLFSLRDSLVHLKPEVIDLQKPSKIVEALASRGLCRQIDPTVMQSWVQIIGTRSVARWACNVVAEMTEAIFAAIPGTEFPPPTMLHMDNRGVAFGRVT